MDLEKENNWLDDLSDTSQTGLSSQSEDLESTPSSRCSSIISYDYNPDDFPKENEIEEFQSPSFFWPPSRTASRSQSSAGPSPDLGGKTLSEKLAPKLQIRMSHLKILLSLSDVAGVDYFSSIEILSESQQTLEKAIRFTTKSFLKEDLVNMVREMDAAVKNISDLLLVKGALAMPILLADLVVKTAGEVPVQHNWYGECQALKSAAEQLSELLWVAARNDLYEQATRHIIADAEKALGKAASAVRKCASQGNIARRIFTSVSAHSFKRIVRDLENSINNVSWLLRLFKSFSSGEEDNKAEDSYFGLPPVASHNPVLYLIWVEVAKLLKGSPKEKADAAASLVLAVARDNSHFVQLVIEQGGVEPLVKLLEEGDAEAQKSAGHVLGLLGRYPESTNFVVIDCGSCSVLAKVLKEGVIEVQAMAAWAISQLAAHGDQYRDLFAQHGAVELLIGCVLYNDEMDGLGANNQQLDHSGHEIHYLVSMAARALGVLSKENPRISRTIVDSRLMVMLPVLIEKSPQEVQDSTALLLLEIARVAERDAEFRCYAFNPAFEAGTAVVDLLLRIVAKAEYSGLLLSCIEALGCLSKIFWTTEVTKLLVRLLNGREEDVMRVTAKTLIKFTEKENYLHKSHCKAIAEGGAESLVQLVYLGDNVRWVALQLACHVSSQVQDNKELATVVEWASKQSDIVRSDVLQFVLANWEERRLK